MILHETHFIKTRKSLLLLFAIAMAVFTAAIWATTAHAIYPEYLKNGRTYDQESNYIQWSGPVSYVTLYHKDNTTLPASEGGDTCTDGCTEVVTKIGNGGSISGNFTFLKTFSVQSAQSGASGVGRLVVKACGQTIYNSNMYLAGTTVPGFANQPNTAWNVPTAGDCTWSVSATGGFVYLRAITTTYRTATGAPSVDLRINGSDGPVNLSEPGSPTLSWTSSEAASCNASSDWLGSKATNGSEIISNLPAGAYTYTLTCKNPLGSTSDTVVANVYGPIQVDVQINGGEGPISLIEPAAYTVSWTSSNASACQAEGSLSGEVELDGLREFNNVLQGDYSYTIRCSNPLGNQALDTVQVHVGSQLPVVDLKIDSQDSLVTIVDPASYTLTWTSQYANSCNAGSTAGDWSGAVAVQGTSPFVAVPEGSRSYTLTCTNASGSSSDMVSVVILPPLTGTISPLSASLLLFGPSLGQPAQTLMGTVSGGIPPYTVTVSVRSPTGGIVTYNVSGTIWSLSPDDSGDPNFGVIERGTWTAWVDIRDSGGHTFRTDSATWEVSWYPVHGRP